MKIAILSVSRQGYALSEKLKERYPQAVLYTSGPWGSKDALPIEPNLKTLTGKLFTEMEALVFVMASGIAVRMIAPYLQGKDQDPGVLVLDDLGKWVIPILSGHLGGANALAQEMAANLGAQAVVTTATDGRGLTAVDLLAMKYSWVITSLEAAKGATAALLEGQTLGVYTQRKLAEPLPEGYLRLDKLEASEDLWRIVATPYTREPLSREVWLIPRCITLGIGCRRDTSFEAVREMVTRTLNELNLDPRSISKIATIDLKADEPALIALSQGLGAPLITYTPEILGTVAQQFVQSEFVKQTTGVGAVAEPAGLLASGGRCLQPRLADNGITLSIWEDC